MLATLCHERDTPTQPANTTGARQPASQADAMLGKVGLILFAPFRLPGAGAGAAHALAPPNATAPAAGQPAGAVRPLAAGRYDDPDGPIRGDPALHGDRAASVISDHAIADLHAVAVGGVAEPAPGDDEDAPGAIIDGTGGRRARDTGQNQDSAQNSASNDPEWTVRPLMARQGSH
jgi:hypothetical protein